MNSYLVSFALLLLQLVGYVCGLANDIKERGGRKKAKKELK